MEISFVNVLGVFVGAGVGASLRIFLSELSKLITPRIWLGTLLANLLGASLLFIIVKYSLIKNTQLDYTIRVAMLGSLTTFSAFSMELVTLVKNTSYMEALLVLLLNVLGGVMIGVWILSQESV